MAMCTAVEKIHALQNMLHCLGLQVNAPTKMFGNNMAIIQNASFPDADLKKKHVAISHHAVKEAVATGHVPPLPCAIGAQLQ